MPGQSPKSVQPTRAHKDRKSPRKLGRNTPCAKRKISPEKSGVSPPTKSKKEQQTSPKMVNNKKAQTPKTRPLSRTTPNQSQQGPQKARVRGEPKMSLGTQNSPKLASNPLREKSRQTCPPPRPPLKAAKPAASTRPPSLMTLHHGSMRYCPILPTK